MKKLINILNRAGQGVFKAIARFPLTVVCLVGAGVILCYIISLEKQLPIIIQKLIFTFLFGAMLGAAATAACERFERLQKLRIAAFAVSAVITAGYFALLLPAAEIGTEVIVRTLAAVFALLCAFLWLPSMKGKVDFNLVALINFKAAFTSILYSGVLWLGFAAIIATVDTLLFNVSYRAYSYLAVVVWVLFAPIYYLSLLPMFHSQEEYEREKTERMSRYPKFLEILISYIAIPLITVYSVVLGAYFIKILVTLKWPSGQLGPMVLAYSAAGLILYVLASLLTNRFAVVYRKIFPKVLIPVVIMQLISVTIRLRAYGVTESRYYVALFGIYSIVCAILLSVGKIKRNGVIALLAAGFAVISVLPPVDAFTVSRYSQISRLERILTKQGMLQNGLVTPMPTASLDTKREVTNILNYLNNRGYTSSVKWLPKGFQPYAQMKTVFGFESYYGGNESVQNRYVSGNTEQLAVTGFDVLMNLTSSSYNKTDELTKTFTIRGTSYRLHVKRLSSTDANITLVDSSEQTLAAATLYGWAKPLLAGEQHDNLPQEKMTFETKNGEYTLRIVFQNISETSEGVDYSFYALVSAPAGSRT